MIRVEVLVETLDDSSFRASVTRPVSVSAEASSRDDAVSAVRDLLATRLHNAELLELEFPTAASRSLPAICDGWANHPDAADVIQHMSDYRRSVDQDAERP